MTTKADMANMIVKLMEQLNPIENTVHEDLMVEAIKILEPDLVLTDSLKTLMIKGETWYTPDFEDNEFEETLTLDQYQKEAMTTIAYDNLMIKTLEEHRLYVTHGASFGEDEIIKMLKLFYLTTGITGEAGEVAEKVKKLFRNDDGAISQEFLATIKKEIGDVLWYLAVFCFELGFSLEDVARANLEKLKLRQQKGLIKSEGDNREE